MAEDIADILQGFTLLNKELQITELGTQELAFGIKECQSSLLGKIVGEKIANFTGVKNFVTSAWGYPRDLTVAELGPNLFQFILPRQDDRERIAQGGPWIIDNQLLVLNSWYEGIENDEKAFNLAPLWVQVWNLPVHYISKEVGKKIGSVFHLVKDVIIPQTGGKEGRHLKLAVVVDITQPLLRGTTIKVAGIAKWIQFKYERCPDFCYKCGRIGHSERSCSMVVCGREGQKDNQYEIWMRAGYGNGPKSVQKTNSSVIFNPQRHHWNYQNGEWLEKDGPESQAFSQRRDGSPGLIKELQRQPVHEQAESQQEDYAKDKRKARMEGTAGTSSNIAMVANREVVALTELPQTQYCGDLP
ncbi:uncharacterized protein [Coffea arabica]|uniref:CCHC-type domain-containing protein n=1 Tax=Coffea arabica TaxID=13443 RepID=A0A6P6SZX9_COFAR|nr:uncharacterized protein LOC113696384 [Coffea arabica]